jgi:hypothetical protein
VSIGASPVRHETLACGTLDNVTDRTELGFDLIIEALDEDLADPESEPSQLLSAGPTRLALAVARSDRYASILSLLQDPGLGNIRLNPLSRDGTVRWQCSCGQTGECAQGSSFYESMDAHLAEHRLEYDSDA